MIRLKEKKTKKHLMEIKKCMERKTTGKYN